MADKNIKKTNASITISQQSIEACVFSPENFEIVAASSIPLPRNLLDADGDKVLNYELLGQTLKEIVKSLNTKINTFHISVPGTLIRAIEMPKMDKQQYYISLASEAERYKAFEGTEAAIDYSIIETANPNNKQATLLLSAIRQDTLVAYQHAAKIAKIKVSSIGPEQFSVLRAMAGTGVLDSLLDQIGNDALWGTIMAERSRLRLSLWQGTEMLEFREVQMDLSSLSADEISPYILDDLNEEVIRTTKHRNVSIWLQYGLSPHLSQALSAKIGMPVSPCVLGPGLKTPQANLSIAAIGTAMTSFIDFPAVHNIRASAVAASAKPVAAATEDITSDSPSSMIAMGIGGFVMAASVVVLAGMFIFNQFWLIPQAEKIKADNTAQELKLAQLTATKDRLQQEVAVNEALISMVQNAKVRNKLYVDFTNDLRKKTPQKLWLSEPNVDDKIEIKGHAMTHQDVIDFARNFDGVPYASAVLINSIQEVLMGGQGIFEFAVGGTTKLNPQLLAPKVTPGTAANTPALSSELSKGTPANGAQ